MPPKLGIFRTLILALCLIGIPVTTTLAVDFQLYDSPFPSENYNGPATNTSLTGGLTDPATARTTEVDFYPAAFVFVPREPDELYVMGGGLAVKTYIAKVQPEDLSLQRWVTLDRGTAPYWSPSIVVHANGYIYVTAQNICYKFDAQLNEIGYYVLPITDGKYNSLKVFSDGNLVTKGFTTDESSLTVLDQDLNPLVAELVTSEVSYGRLCVDRHRDKEYVYVTKDTTLVRFEYASQQLTLDTGWQYQYRQPDSGTTAGGAVTCLGNRAFFLDNADPDRRTRDPIHLHSVNLDNASDADVLTPFGLPDGYSFNKHLLDPTTGIIVLADQTNSWMGAYRHLEDEDRFETVWTKPYNSGILCSASAAQKQLYVSDFVDRRDNIVILDIETGEELRRIVTSSRVASLAGFSVGWNQDIFYNSTKYSVRIYNDEPLSVLFTAFQALPDAQSNAVMLYWQAEPDQDCLGWNVYRRRVSVSTDQQQNGIPANGDDGWHRLNGQLIRENIEDVGTRHAYIDEESTPAGATFEYRIEAVFIDGTRRQSWVERLSFVPTTDALHTETQLFPNYPNPFNPETWFPYSLGTDASVTICIFSSHGQLVRQLDLGNQTAGLYLERERAAYWDGRDSAGELVASGSYFYMLQTEDFVRVRKLVIRK